MPTPIAGQNYDDMEGQFAANTPSGTSFLASFVQFLLSPFLYDMFVILLWVSFAFCVTVELEL